MEMEEWFLDSEAAAVPVQADDSIENLESIETSKITLLMDNECADGIYDISDFRLSPPFVPSTPDQDQDDRPSIMKNQWPAITYPTFSINMTAGQVVQTAKELGVGDLANFTITDCKCNPADPSSIRLNPEQLYPYVAQVIADNKEWVMSEAFQVFCLNQPVCLVSNLDKVLELDLSLYSSKTLLEIGRQQVIEVREQTLQPSGQNLVNGEISWRCVSDTCLETVEEYVSYQLNNIYEYHRKVVEACQDYDQGPPSKELKLASETEQCQIRFGTNFDLSDQKIWKRQLEELNKLPQILRVCNFGTDMLQIIGHEVLGMNTVQVYMKVPGCRTPGHQENNNICSVNINIGPGDCEWFAVPNEYWSTILKLCQEKGIDYLRDPWWPDLEELKANNVPVYRFLQKTGDVVWVNYGCVHWVQSNAWCNNIAWNVAPFNDIQYQAAVERYEWNKTQKYKSLVPMINLSWTMADTFILNNLTHYKQIKTCLMKSLAQCVKIREFTTRNGIEVRFHGREPGEHAFYCKFCQEEIFNYAFTVKERRRIGIYCANCAKQHPTSLKNFVCLEVYSIESLMNVYDAFTILQHV